MSVSKSPKWDVRNEGRAWKCDATFDRYMLKPHKIELVKGKLLFPSQEREILHGLLLENVGADRAAQLGDPEVWRAAIAKLPR